MLFGHEKGAFTGATEQHVGKFVEAHGGTLFLDEIGELPLEAQVKLLRAIQEGEIDPVGGGGSVKVDIRLISATNKNLLDLVKAAGSARTCSTASTSSRSRCRRCASRRDDIAELAAALHGALRGRGGQAHSRHLPEARRC